MPLRHFLILLLTTLPAPAAAQASRLLPAAEDTAAVRLGLRQVPLPFRTQLSPPPGQDAFFLRPRFEDWVGSWADARRTRLSGRWAVELVEPELPDIPSAAVGAREDDPRAGRAARDSARLRLPGGVGQHADIGMRVDGRGELGGAWTRFQPCTPGLALNCNPGALPQLKPDIQFGLQVGGTISQRVHVNVDYDQRREFDAANNISVYYQGLEDEILQRVEVGDVSIQLPPSRYITQGIPAGNFGFKASGEVGPMRFQGVWAQQKGDVSTREFRLGGGRGTSGLVQDNRTALDDADYVRGQFFFLIHPDSIRGAPHFDIVTLKPTDAPGSLAPAGQGSPIEVYRDDGVAAGRQQTSLGYFPADAVSADGATQRSGQFRLLDSQEDYYVHPSGLWLVLRQPLQVDQSLAIAYRTRDGQVVGTLNATSSPTKPTLRLVRGPLATHQPGQSTWPYEMHHVYLVNSSSGVDRNDVQLSISLGDEARGVTYRDIGADRVPLLQLFGLDETAPQDRLDFARIFQPSAAAAATGEETKISGTYIVFPTLRPFAAPPPVPSRSIDAEQARLALAADTNAVIYDHPDPVVRESSTRYRLNLQYRVRMEGLVSSFNLGAFGIRDGSERIMVDGRPLERDLDYTINYETGEVTLADAQAVFGTNPNAEIRATWEQQALFAIAPTSVFGLNTSFRIGERGELNLMGLYQEEKSIMTRPQLGTEPGSIVLGGASGRYTLDAPWMDRALDALPLLRAAGATKLSVSGELAFSSPTPNTRGDTYLDDFQGGDEVSLALTRNAWRLGSRPQNLAGATDYLPGTLGVHNAAAFVWQHDFREEGIVGGARRLRDIDRQINQIGAIEQQEQVLWVTFGDTLSSGAEKSWRSLTTPLSTTGRDMSRTEYIEFYVYSHPTVKDAALVLDIGTISEDAFYYDVDGNLRGAVDGRPWGEDLLDEEASTLDRELWGDQADARGLWNQPCQAQRGAIYPVSDPLANCLRGNGINDTEDLDGNGALDPNDGAHFRYVIPLDEPGHPYLVRDLAATGTDFRLYRVPLRGPGAIPLNNASDGTWRYVKHLRVTFAGQTPLPGGPNFGITRMRLVGSRWTKRDLTGVMRGVVADSLPALAAATNFRVGPVSRVTDGAVYSSPPGVLERGQTSTSGLSATGEETNERSLRLSYDQLEPAHRGEVYFRYPQQPRNLMTYRDLRFWAVARSGHFGPGGTQTLLVKAGTDGRNYYLYRSELRPSVGETVRSTDWSEHTVDFNRWFELKARAEQRLIVEGAPPAGQLLVEWSEDSTYAVVLEDRARAPNLAAIRELSFAVYNGDVVASSGELWLNELRLGGGMTQAGVAGNVAFELRGGDFLSASVSYASRGALFQQLNQDASYLTSGDVVVRSTAQLGQLVPAGWGVAMPLEVSTTRNDLAPMFLDRSDVRAPDLEGLRSTGASATRIGMSIRKTTPTANPWVGALVDGTVLQFGYSTGSTSATTALNESDALNGSLTYSRQLPKREVDVTPAFVVAALRALVPAIVERSSAFQALTSTNLRWTPDALSFGTSYHDQSSRAFRYEHFIASAADTLTPVTSMRRGLDSNFRLALRPFESLTADVTATSTRDLLDPEQAARRVHEREALRAARSSFAGADVGWETSRSLGTALDFRPTVAGWLKPSVRYSATFRTDRNPGYLELRTDASGDTTATLQRGFQADRQLTRGLQFDAGGLVGALLGTPQAASGLAHRYVHRMARLIAPVELTWDDALGSQFEREVIDPGFGYQLGFGSLGSFRHIGTDTATAATQRALFRARSGLRLPLGSMLSVSYGNSESDYFDGAGGVRMQRERNWPSLGLTWNRIPLPSVLDSIITNPSITTRYEESHYSTLYGASRDEVSAQDRGRFRREIPFTFSFGVMQTLTASYALTLSTGEERNPTGDSEMSQTTHRFQASGTLVPAAASGRELRQPIQATFGYTYNAQQQCGFRPGAADPAAGTCTRFSDVIGRGFDLTLETIITDLNVGLQMSYNSNAHFVGTRNQTSQFQVGLFGQFQFNAGRMPGARMPGR